MENLPPRAAEQASPVCPCCKRSFTCGLQSGHAECWCADLPPLAPPTPETKSCYCPDCLRALAEAQAAAR